MKLYYAFLSIFSLAIARITSIDSLIFISRGVYETEKVS